MIVETSCGPVRGTAAGATTRFLGVPYAEAERWRAPQPAAPWDDVLQADAYGPAAPQPDRPIGLWFHGPTPATDERCLSLNLWTPGGEGKPVLVWFHGGGWALGFSGSALFDGAALAAAADAIVVTVNYRLGTLGYLNDAELGANWGLQDQAAALRWVRDNAAAFGGDPANVTAWGQSAGAGSVLQLLSSPLGEGLFARAIAQSPPLGELTVPRALGDRWTAALLQHFGADHVDALRAQPAGAIVDAHEALLATPDFRGTRGGAMPVEDAATLPQDPRKVPDARLEIPVLIGTTAHEGRFLFRAAGRRIDPEDGQLRAIVSHLPDVTDADATMAAAREADPDADANTLLCAIATQQLFHGPVEEWAGKRAAAGGEVHRYRVAHESPGDEELGSVHAIDVPLVFGTYGTDIGRPVAGDGVAARAVSGELVAAWRAFVRGQAPWPAGETAVLGVSTAIRSA